MPRKPLIAAVIAGISGSIISGAHAEERQLPILDPQQAEASDCWRAVVAWTETRLQTGAGVPPLEAGRVAGAAPLYGRPQTLRDQLLQLENAAFILAANGREDACAMIYDTMRDLWRQRAAAEGKID